MPSQTKLIKQGIRYTDAVFDEIIHRLEQGVKSTDTLEDFLVKYQEYTQGKGKMNPLVLNGYDVKMLDIILQETNNHKFSRPAQKELVRVTIENKVGELIRNVGDDIVSNVRDIVKYGYNNGLSQDEIAKEISSKVTSIKNKRARAIARTEIARTATISDYVISSERGATHFYVECRNTACPICKEAWHKGWTIENDDTYTPSDTSAGGKGWIGNKTYKMSQTDKLPPIHPNCRCVPYFYKDKKAEPIDTKTTTGETTTTQEPTKEQLRKNLTATERTKYANYKRLVDSHTKWLKENPDAAPKAIDNHKQKLLMAQQGLNELRQKALGGTGGTVKPEPNSEPKPTPKPKPESETTPKPEPKPKTPKEPKKPKPEKEPTQTQTPTREQLYKNLTKKERETYKEHKDMIDWANRVLNNPESTDKQKTYAQTRLDDILPKFNKLNNKALGLTPKTTSKKTSKSKRKSKKKEKEIVELNKPKNARLTKEECDSLTFEQLADHHGAKYNGLGEGEDGKQYHIFEQTFDNGETFKLYFEKGAVNSYKKGEVATANEIIHEVFKVPEVLRKETDNIYFKNTQGGRVKNLKGKFRAFKGNVAGHNTSRNRSLRRQVVQDQSTKHQGYDDPNHKIGINPKNFKKLKDFYDIITWRDRGDQITSWKHVIHHEFMHSIQDSRNIWRNGLDKLHDRDDYRAIDKEENYFTKYANTVVSESFAEHGGYVSYMLANPEEQSKKISISHYDRDENNKIVSINEEIDFEEYKKRYPKHYKYFVDLIKNGAGKYETE